MEGSLLAHVPPVTELFKLILPDRHSELLPVITGAAGAPLTVISNGREVTFPHGLLLEYVISVFPALTGVIFPVASIVATEGSLLAHVPPVSELFKLIVPDKQRKLVPVIVGVAGA